MSSSSTSTLSSASKRRSHAMSLFFTLKMMLGSGSIIVLQPPAKPVFFKKKVQESFQKAMRGGTARPEPSPRSGSPSPCSCLAPCVRRQEAFEFDTMEFEGVDEEAEAMRVAALERLGPDHKHLFTNPRQRRS